MAVIARAPGAVSSYFTEQLPALKAQVAVGENEPVVLLLENEIISPSIESIVPSIIAVHVVGESTYTEDGEHETSIDGAIKCPTMLPEPKMLPLLLMLMAQPVSH